MQRRDALAYLGGAGLGLGTWRAVDNVVLGYGVVTGTNLLEQDLEALANERLRVRGRRYPVEGRTVLVGADGEAIAVDDGDERLATLSVHDSSPEDAADLDAELGFESAPLETIVADMQEIDDRGVAVEPLDYDEFFERVRDGETRPLTIDAVRGPTFSGAPPAVVEEFTGADPSRPKAVVEGLVDGFREHARYDVSRYVAGSVEDNVIMRAADLRQHFEGPTTLEAMVEGTSPGMFCTELTIESARALHAVPAAEQRTPVVAVYVHDDRHKHVYTGIASVLREDGRLVVPMTFVDYTYSTLYDDLRLTWLLGEGLEAYDSRHRADTIYWSR